MHAPLLNNKSKVVVSVFLVTLLLMTNFAVLASADESAPHMSNTEVLPPEISSSAAHVPIRIDNDSSFTAQNGVVSGNGTENSPYVLKGWNIEGNGSSYGIYVGNTTSYFVIENCNITNASYSHSEPYFPGASIVLYNVSHGRICNNTIDTGYYGIYMNSSSGVEIKDNVISGFTQGMALISSYNNTVSSNDIIDSHGYAPVQFYGIKGEWRFNERTLYNTSALTENSLDDMNPVISNNGYVAWQGWDGHDWEIYLWDGSTIHRITNDSYNDTDPVMNAKGDIAWLGHNGENGTTEIYFWNGSTIKRITNNTYDEGYLYLGRNMLVWSAEGNIYFWDGTSITQLTNDSDNNFGPQADDYGDIAWMNYNATWNYMLKFWDGHNITNISEEQGALSFDMNRTGAIVYSMVNDTTGDYAIYLWDRGNISVLDNDDWWDCYDPYINDNGWVTWVRSHYDYDGETVELWNGSSMRTIARADYMDTYGIADNGWVVWYQEGNLSSDSDLWIWNGQEARPLTLDRYYEDEPGINATGSVVWYDNSSGNNEIYLFNGFDGKALDSSGNGNDGIPMNGTTTSMNGYFGRSAYFDGNDDYVDIPMTVNYSQLTVYAWFNINSSFTGNPRLVASGHTDSDHTGFQLMVNGTLTDGFFDVGNGSAVANAYWNYTIEPGKWYFAALTYNGSSVRAYINGELVGQANLSGNVSYAGYPVNIGRNPAYKGDYFHGYIDNVAIYDRALSSSEIRELYDKHIGVYVENCSGNTFIYNNISGWHDYGMYLKSSLNNTIVNNNFENNSVHAYDDGSNTWYMAYPQGGNYWDNWTSPDINNDGFTDSAFGIPGGSNRDIWPHTAPDGWNNPHPPQNVYVQSMDMWFEHLSDAMNYVDQDDTLIIRNGTYNTSIASWAPLTIKDSTFTLLGDIRSNGYLRMVNVSADVRNVYVPSGSSLSIVDSPHTVISWNVWVNGAMYVNSSVWEINNTYDGEHNIVVNSTGKLVIQDSGSGPSTLKAYSSGRYGLTVNRDAGFTLSGSTLRDCGWNESHPGLVIYADSPYINNATITSCYYGVSLMGVKWPRIYNSHIYGNTRGIVLNGSSSDYSMDGMPEDFVEISRYRYENTENFSRYDMNNNGWIVWQAYDGHDYEIYLWNGDRVIRLTDNQYDDEFPVINNRNEVAWSGHDGNDYDIYLWKNGITSRITDNSYDNIRPSINDNGWIAWTCNEGSDYEVYLWNGTAVQDISNDSTDNDWLPLISDNNTVVWKQRTPSYNNNLMLWNGTGIRQLNSGGDAGGYYMNSGGWVVWSQDTAYGYQLFLWNGSAIRQITNNSFSNSYATMNSDGWIVWKAENPTDSHDNRILLWNGTAVINVTDNSTDDTKPVVNDMGEVAYERDLGEPTMAVFFWKDGSEHRISGVPGCDSGSYILMNNMGTVIWGSYAGNTSGIYAGNVRYGARVSGNIIENNGYGIYATGTSDNLFYHNAFINNTVQAYDDGNDTWNLPYDDGGNYWDNWTSPDVNGDGFVDNAYHINGGLIDYWPFTNSSGWEYPHPGRKVYNLNQTLWYGDIQSAVFRAYSGNVLEIINDTYNGNVVVERNVVFYNSTFILNGSLNVSSGTLRIKKCHMDMIGNGIDISDGAGIRAENSEIRSGTIISSGELGILGSTWKMNETSDGEHNVYIMQTGGFYLESAYGKASHMFSDGSRFKIMAYYGSSFRAENSTLRDLGWSYSMGTWIESAGAYIYNVTITNSSSPLSFLRTDNISVINGRIAHCYGQTGIYVYMSKDVRIINNTFEDIQNGAYYVESHIEVEMSNNVLIENNTLKDGKTAVSIEGDYYGYISYIGETYAENINDMGETTWSEVMPDGSDREIFLWNGAHPIRITYDDHDDIHPSLNDNGWIAWQGWDGHDWEIYLWNGTTISRISNDSFNDTMPVINSAGDIAWIQSDGNNYSVMYWNGTSHEIFTINGTVENMMMKGGWIAWDAFVGNTSEIYLWNGTSVNRITNNSYNDTLTGMNDNGWLVWYGYDGNDNEIYLWNGTGVLRITNNTENDELPYLNNIGDIVWQQRATHGWKIYLWSVSNGIRMIADTYEAGTHPVMNDAGVIAWVDAWDELIIYKNGSAEYYCDADYGKKIYMNSAGTVVATRDGNLFIVKESSIFPENITVNRNHMSNFSEEGIYGEGRRFHIVNNDMKNTAGSAIYVGNIANSEITGNTIDNVSSGDGIYITTWESTCRDIYIADNVLSNISEDGIMIEYLSDIYGIKILNNTISSNGKGIYIAPYDDGWYYGYENKTHDVNIELNMIRSKGDGIYINGTEGLSIGNNSIKDSSGYAMHLKRASDVRINENIIDNTSDGIWLNDDLTSPGIYGNRLSNISGNGLVMGGIKDADIHDNTFTNITGTAIQLKAMPANIYPHDNNDIKPITEGNYIAWYGDTGNGYGIYLWDSSNGTRLIARNESWGQDDLGIGWGMNSMGEIYWVMNESGTYRLYLWNGTGLRVLAESSYITAGPRCMNENGWLVWSEIPYNESDMEIYLWNGHSVMRLTNDSYNDSYPAINGPGHVAWTARDNVTNSTRIFIWNGTSIREIQNISWSGFAPDMIWNMNDMDQFAWRGFNGNQSDIFFWNGSAVVKITEDIYSEAYPFVDASGNVYWKSMSGGSVRIMTNRGGYVKSLGDSYMMPWSGPNIRGMLAWNYSGNVFIYDGNLSRSIDAKDAIDPYIGNNGITVWASDTENPAGNNDIFVFMDAKNVKIYNNTVNGAVNAIDTDCPTEETSIYENLIDGVQDRGISVYYSLNTTIYGNRMNSTYKDIRVFECRHAVIHDNVLLNGSNNHAYSGIELDGPIYSALISNNSIKGYREAISLNGDYAGPHYEIEHAEVDNNTVVDSYTSIALENARFARVSDNTLDGAYIGILSSNFGVDVHSNVLKDIEGVGVAIEDTQNKSHFSIRDNTIDMEENTTSGICGIGLYDSAHAEIINNTIDGHNVTQAGIWLEKTSWVNVSKCTIMNVRNGTWGSSIENTSITDMYITGVEIGIYAENSKHADVYGNSIYLEGTEIQIYLVALGIGFIYGTDLRITDNTIYNRTTALTVGVMVKYMDGVTVSKNTISDISVGIFVDEGASYEVSYNEIYGGSMAPSFIASGIVMAYSNNSSIHHNRIINSPNRGIYVLDSEKVSIYRNEIYGGGNGTYFYRASNCSFYMNNVTDNHVGIYLNDSRDNTIYLNNFINNTEQGYDNMGPNRWNSDYRIGGNYWSDYSGPDYFSGPDQDLPGSDGIGDVPYPIAGPAGSKDMYPTYIMKDEPGYGDIKIVSQHEGEHVSGTIVVEATSTYPDLLAVEFYVNGTSVGVDARTPYQTIIDTTKMPDGTVLHIRAKAIRRFGTPGYAYVNLTVMNHVPVVNCISVVSLENEYHPDEAVSIGILLNSPPAYDHLNVYLDAKSPSGLIYHMEYTIQHSSDLGYVVYFRLPSDAVNGTYVVNVTVDGYSGDEFLWSSSNSTSFNVSGKNMFDTLSDIEHSIADLHAHFNSTWYNWTVKFNAYWDYFNSTSSGMNASIQAQFADVRSRMNLFENNMTVLLDNLAGNVSRVDENITAMNITMSGYFTTLKGENDLTQSMISAYWSDWNGTMSDIRSELNYVNLTVTAMNMSLSEFRNEFRNFWNQFNNTDFSSPTNTSVIYDWFNRTWSHISTSEGNISSMLMEQNVNMSSIDHNVSSMDAMMQAYFRTLWNSGNETHDMISTYWAEWNSTVARMQSDMAFLNSTLQYVRGIVLWNNALLRQMWSDFNSTWSGWNAKFNAYWAYFNTTAAGMNASMQAQFADVRSRMNLFENNMTVLLDNLAGNVSRVDENITAMNITMNGYFTTLKGENDLTQSMISAYWSDWNGTMSDIRSELNYMNLTLASVDGNLKRFEGEFLTFWNDYNSTEAGNNAEIQEWFNHTWNMIRMCDGNISSMLIEQNMNISALSLNMSALNLTMQSYYSSLWNSDEETRQMISSYWGDWNSTMREMQADVDFLNSTMQNNDARMLALLNELMSRLNSMNSTLSQNLSDMRSDLLMELRYVNASLHSDIIAQILNLSAELQGVNDSLSEQLRLLATTEDVNQLRDVMSATLSSMYADLNDTKNNTNMTLDDLRKLDSILTDIQNLENSLQDAQDQVQGSIGAGNEQQKSATTLNTVLLIILIIIGLVSILMQMKRGGRSGGKEPESRDESEEEPEEEPADVDYSALEEDAEDL